MKLGVFMLWTELRASSNETFAPEALGTAAPPRVEKRRAAADERPVARPKGRAKKRVVVDEITAS